MKLLTKINDYDNTIELANNLKGYYDNEVIFHCYWNGSLSEKHLYSIMSCYYFNVVNNKKNKIILWLEHNKANHINVELSKYCEMKYFSIEKEKSNITCLKDFKLYNFGRIAFYSDLVRLILLYNYGGCWFDLDCFFLKSFEPLFFNFKNEICVYRWEHKMYPNNAIFICLEPKSSKLENNMIFFIKNKKGFGFQKSKITFNTKELDMLVLPCSWFDGSWIKNPYNITVWNSIFKTTNQVYNFDNFFKGSFCFHWHNRWKEEIYENSIIMQLINIIKNDLQNNK